MLGFLNLLSFLLNATSCSWDGSWTVNWNETCILRPSAHPIWFAIKFRLLKVLHRSCLSVHSFYLTTKKHRRWEPVGDEESPEEQKADVPELDSPSDLPRRPASVPGFQTLAEAFPTTADSSDDSS
ncbi:hypothetical protein MLD38_005579 [Melastoma candidum]|uniref:Uncharacterized protein n=1 Tax=Melastoma candidum TaxID=119954 RepID=A0ACB9RJV6_9MYRT|nr:hypothetical protein MLD38_005579 [Melastoma candidum]